MIGATTINHPLSSTGGIVLQQSSFVFMSPFFNGSYRVSNKGLRNPNSPCIVIIICPDKFSKGISIIPSQKEIRWVVHAGIIRGWNHLICYGFLSNLLLYLILLLVPLLHKCDLLLRRSSLVILLLVLLLLVLVLPFILRGIKIDSLLGHTF